MYIIVMTSLRSSSKFLSQLAAIVKTKAIAEGSIAVVITDVMTVIIAIITDCN